MDSIVDLLSESTVLSMRMVIPNGSVALRCKEEHKVAYMVPVPELHLVDDKDACDRLFETFVLPDSKRRDEMVVRAILARWKIGGVANNTLSIYELAEVYANIVKGVRADDATKRSYIARAQAFADALDFAKEDNVGDLFTREFVRRVKELLS